MLGEGERRLIVCHAGSGASISALMDGAPMATSMGFTPLEGLMMGSRSGSVDPGILLHALRKKWLDVEGLERTLNTRSGLLGVSGVSADYRSVERAAAAGVARAALALELHARVLRAAIGSLVATLGGVDALVFTGGIGENSASMRARACAGLDCLGLSIDPDANATAAPDSDVARPRSQGRILVVRSQEDAVLAREARRLLAGG
jgi:acetate kinase